MKAIYIYILETILRLIELLGGFRNNTLNTCLPKCNEVERRIAFWVFKLIIVFKNIENGMEEKAQEKSTKER